MALAAFAEIGKGQATRGGKGDLTSKPSSRSKCAPMSSTKPHTHTRESQITALAQIGWASGLGTFASYLESKKTGLKERKGEKRKVDQTSTSGRSI